MFCFPLLTLLLSFIINGSFIGRYIGHRGSKVIIISISLCFITLILCFITLILCFITLILCFITLILCFITLISSMIIWYEVIYGGCEAYINLFGTWISVGSMNINWDIYYDILSVHMLLTLSVLSVVSFAVHCYSMVYMRNDPYLNLFISYLSLFTFFMVVLVSANNMADFPYSFRVGPPSRVGNP